MPLHSRRKLEMDILLQHLQEIKLLFLRRHHRLTLITICLGIFIIAGLITYFMDVMIYQEQIKSSATSLEEQVAKIKALEGQITDLQNTHKKELVNLQAQIGEEKTKLANLTNELDNTKNQADNELKKIKGELETASSQANILRVNLKKTIESTEQLLSKLNIDIPKEEITEITEIPAGIEQINKKYADLRKLSDNEPFSWNELNSNQDVPTLLTNIKTNIDKSLDYINTNDENFTNNPYKRASFYSLVIWYFQWNDIPAEAIGYNNPDWQALLAKLQTGSAKILAKNIIEEQKIILSNIPPPSAENLIIQSYQSVWEKQIMADRKRLRLSIRLYQDLLQLKCLVLAKK